MNIDVDSLTIGDLEDFEEAAGVSFMQAAESGSMSAKAMKALVWITQRKQDPSFSLDDARNVEVSKVEFKNTAVDLKTARSNASSKS